MVVVATGVGTDVHVNPTGQSVGCGGTGVQMKSTGQAGVCACATEEPAIDVTQNAAPRIITNIRPFFILFNRLFIMPSFATRRRAELIAEASILAECIKRYVEMCTLKTARTRRTIFQKFSLCDLTFSFQRFPTRHSSARPHNGRTPFERIPDQTSSSEAEWYNRTSLTAEPWQ